MHREHAHAARVSWIGPAAGSTLTYAGYSREHAVEFEGKPVALRVSADPLFRGDATLANPEELLVAALSSCHLLSYLALCARAGIEVLAYEDRVRGTMAESAGAGRFTSVTLQPAVTIANERDRARAAALHAEAHATCFIANSVNFPVRVEPTIRVATPAR
jgi:organic hydroperoxide reductase OsmC/OhrA